MCVSHCICVPIAPLWAPSSVGPSNGDPGVELTTRCPSTSVQTHISHHITYKHFPPHSVWTISSLHFVLLCGSVSWSAYCCVDSWICNHIVSVLWLQRDRQRQDSELTLPFLNRPDVKNSVLDYERQMLLILYCNVLWNSKFSLV